MATVLSKNVIRESTETREGRNILITLTEDQSINLRLKGLRNDGHNIEIGELYDIISGNSHSKSSSKTSGSVMISLHDLRSSNAISSLDYDTKVKFERIITDLIDRM